MAEIILASASFMKELLWISKDVIWKDEYAAYQNEKTVHRYEADLYVLARRGETNFMVFRYFDRDVLLQAGIPADKIDECMLDKNKIPNNRLMRDNIVSLQTAKLLSSYEEKNNYYRMLYGLPDLEDSEKDFFYHPKYPDTPLHKLSINQIYELEGVGYLDELYAAHKDKKYLRHLGKRKIDPYVSRTAEQFSLLYMNYSDFSRINNDFRDTYDACRYSMLRSIYTREKRKNNEYYDNFMAMCVLFMTIQQMLAKYLDADVNRDFYDYESLKYVYDSYGVPFYPTIPLEYHIKIIKNINILIRHKGSTAVFFKLFDLFNFGSMDIYDFYIMKVHRLDENGNPIFKYNLDGSENLKEMYDIKFGQVRLYDNPPLELSDPQNILSYNDMTALDPYWIEDPELIDKLYKTKFNYLESKYIGIRTVFDLMAITYETAIFFKLITDNRLALNRVTLYFSALNEYIDLFSFIMYISALMCKRYGYEGRLDGDPVYVARILGYNFKADLDELVNDVKANPSVSGDSELLELMTLMYVSSTHSVNQVYGKINALRELLVKRRISATTKEAYQAYSEIENALMCSYYARESFKKIDGTQAETFSDMLSDTCPTLYVRYNEIHCGEDTSMIDTEIESLLVVLSQTFTNLKYIEMCGASSSNLLLEHLFKLLSFFKSAKAELTGYNISYTLSKRGESMMKLFSDSTERVRILIDNGCTCDPDCDKCETCKDGSKTPKITWTYDENGDVVRVIDNMADPNQQCRCSGCGNHVWLRTDMTMYLYMYCDDNEITFKFRDDFPVKYGYPVESAWWLTSDIEDVSYKYLTIHKFISMLHDTIDKFMPTYFIKDALQFADTAALLFEKIVYEGNSFLINDWFNSLTDSLVKVCDINHIIHRSDFSLDSRIKDWNSNYYDLENVRFDAVVKCITDRNSKINSSGFNMTDRLRMTYEHVIDEDYLEDYL